MSHPHRSHSLVAVLVVLAAVSAGAQGLVQAAGQGFAFSGNRPDNGMLMSLTSKSSVVALANTQTAASLIGIVAPNDSNLSDQTGQVTVQTDGVSSALVSTLNGDIRVGDRITASSISGVGAEATGNGWIVGTAQAGLDAKTAGAIKTDITSKDGQKHAVYVASIPVAIRVFYYATASSPTTTLAPSWIQKLAETLVHRRVSTAALVLSFVLLLIGLVLAVVIISTAVRSSIGAISRQPLAKTQIFRMEKRSIGLAVGILAFALLASFLILRLF